jgi:hypothetical protein
VDGVAGPGVTSAMLTAMSEETGTEPEQTDGEFDDVVGDEVDPPVDEYKLSPR